MRNVVMILFASGRPQPVVDAISVDPAAERQSGPEVIGDAQRLISLCRKMRSKIAKVLSNRTGLHHVRFVEELNTVIRHNPPLVTKDGNLRRLCKSAINPEG